MTRRALGTGGLEVSALGLGTMGMTYYLGEPDENGGIATIERAHELGVTLLDSAELYGDGTGSNEQLVGRAVAGYRAEMQIATKFGFVLPLHSDPDRTYDSRPEHIREVTETSLRHLGTDRIDILYQQRVDPDVPIEDVAGTVGELIAAGKVGHFGLCEVDPETLRCAHAVAPVSVLQSEYSLFERQVEAGVLPVVRELGIGFVAYSPLGRGFLTGEFKPGAEYGEGDQRRENPRWAPGNYERNAAAVGRLRELAERREITVTQLALAWLLHQGEDIVPIFGTRRPQRVAENVVAAEVSLSETDLTEIEEILPEGAYGSGYAEGAPEAV